MSERKRLWKDVLSPLYYDGDTGELVMLDQRFLPAKETWNRYSTDTQVATAIREMVVRGAPAIGCAAAFGLAAASRHYPDDSAGFEKAFLAGVEMLAASRPTAVNLFWALDRQKAVFEARKDEGVAVLREALATQAAEIWKDDIAACMTMGRLGAELLPEGGILTHCNAGALATGGYGTALGVIRAAAESKSIHVFADETRPFLQGARLTAWELNRSGIDVTVICDNMSGTLMREGKIAACVVGSDRIAANGDVANKIGTYMVAVLAARHDIPFYVAAPLSTVDLQTQSGKEIPIEERPAREVTHVGDHQLVPTGVSVRNIAFDVTPADLVTAIITEAGVARPPYDQSIPALFER
jgi:methylthioribose-1-phosphate isomerase